MDSQLAILFLCTFPKINKNGVQRFTHEIINGVKSTEPRAYDLYWTKENGKLRSYIQLLRNFITTIRYVNVVHFVTLTPFNIPFLILAKILKKKIMTSYHGNYLKEISIIKRPHIFLPFWIADKISRVFSDIIVSASANLLDEMKIRQESSYIIPYPFNLKLLTDYTKKDLKTHSGEILFATASNFNIKEKVKGLNYLFDAMDKISEEAKGVRLLVFGFGIHLESFKIKYANSHNIVFMGFREDFGDFLASVDAYIHISGLDNQPYAMIDALMRGKVIICNDLAGLIETIDPNNNYVVSLDSNSISKTLHRVISQIRNQPIDFKEKGNRNKKFAVNRYSSEVISAQYVKLYGELLCAKSMYGR